MIYLFEKGYTLLKMLPLLHFFKNPLPIAFLLINVKKRFF